jgi:chromosome segregation ATPase
MMYRRAIILAGCLSVLAATLGLARVAVAKPQLHDYLSDEEAGEIRDARAPSDRIKLYISFAEDRLQKFDYELNRAVPERNRSEVLNGLLHSYEGCMDDASDEIDDARLQQADIKDALKFMDDKSKSFLARLQKYSKNGRYLSDYSDTLQDAIDSTTDALSNVADAKKNMLPAVVRRKQ